MIKHSKLYNFMHKTKIDIFKQIQKSKSYQHQNMPKWQFFARTCPQKCGNVDNLPNLSPIL